MPPPQMPRIPLDGPGVLALATARQQLAHEGALRPVWDELTGKEHEDGLPDARNCLEPVIGAGLVPEVERARPFASPSGRRRRLPGRARHHDAT